MNKNDEKMQALEVLKAACDAVNNAMEAISDFAEKYGIEPNKKGGTVTIADLAEMVSDEIGMKEECAFAAIACAFDFIKDLELTVRVVEVEEDEEE